MDQNHSHDPEPKTLWPMLNWVETTGQYAGNFFRAEGGGSAPFNQIQEENAPRIAEIRTSYDNSYLNYTNWAPQSPKNSTDAACVQMIAEGSNIGKWNDEPCSKRNNLVACQIPQSWSFEKLHTKLLETREEVEKEKRQLARLKTELQSLIEAEKKRSMAAESGLHSSITAAKAEFQHSIANAQGQINAIKSSPPLFQLIILSAASAPLQPVIKQRGLRSLQQCAFRLRAEQIVSSQAAASTTVSAAAILKQSRISRIPLVYAHTLGHGLKSVTCHSPLVYAHTLDYGSPFPLVYAHTLDYGLHHPFAIKTQR
ncbi:hypothetical protein TYRP_008886 [Tyrophagus putrescentiae]|nr:hypothetical protein TYRP_008886 [Tyrophagus putrescentiae]